MRTKRKAARPRIFQLKVTLLGSRPPIWRRLLVPEDLPFAALHLTLQAAMGWADSHPHLFEVGEKLYCRSDEEYGPTMDAEEDYTGLTLAALRLAKGQRFRYDYDFGDDWQHEILVEEVAAAEGTLEIPICLEGKRACPPEDCGGVAGYARLLAILADRSHPEHREMRSQIRRQIGRRFDPEAFDRIAANVEIQELFALPTPEDLRELWREATRTLEAP